MNKLVILARLAFGRWLDPATVGRRPPALLGNGRPGITGVTDQELEGAGALGLTLKLLATAARADPDDGIEAAVVPTAVPADSTFGRTDGVTNRFEVDATPLGTVGFAGPGAGGAATSSAVLGDLIAVARGVGSTWAGLAPSPAPAIAAADPFDRPRRWYAYVPTTAGSDTMTDDAGRTDRAGLPALLRDSATVAFEDGTAVRTPDATLAEVRAAFATIVPDGVDITLYPVDD